MENRNYYFILVIFLLVATPKSNAGLFDYFTNIANNIAVKSEVRNIAHMIYLDYIGGVDIPDQYELPDYIRANNRAPYGSSRDTAFDNWGSPYQIQRDNIGFKVFSFGADRKRDTEDDISYGFRL